ncbi:hypothetical protein [Nostoc sp.]|uniref:hypothetical protein n=1 Tax=Nostoc sp. TaxID=1180 RepID=UPI002FF61005
MSNSETQQSLDNVGFRSSNATCFKSGNPPNAVAPQPTPVLVFSLNPSVLQQSPGNVGLAFGILLRSSTQPTQFKVFG